MTAQILSTKTLNSSQRLLFLDSKATISEYDAISVNLIPFKSPKTVKNAIFSSQNAMKSMKKHQKELLFGNIQNCFCVGEKTTSILKDNGQNVVKTASNASELAKFIQKAYENEDFYFFCSSHRRDELPEVFKMSKNRLFEIKTYEIESIPVTFKQKVNKILFFSPSGVQSFIAENYIKDALAVCIGETTASEARKHTSNVIISNETTVESVIEKAIESSKIVNN